MREVPRHPLVPPESRAMAYEPRPLPIGEGQSISQPYVVAFMTEILRLKPGDRVLEVGTGSGYQAAIAAKIAGEVYTVEIFPSLADRARRNLESLGFRNVFVRQGDGYYGWKEKAPFDAIIVTCAGGHIPPPPLTPPPTLADKIFPCRLLSVRFWPHFVPLIIAQAMLGFGASGVALHLLRPRIAKEPAKGVSWAVLLAASSFDPVSRISQHV